MAYHSIHFSSLYGFHLGSVISKQVIADSKLHIWVSNQQLLWTLSSPCDKVVLAGHQDVLLTEHMFLLLCLHNVLLLQALQGEG